MNVRMKKRISRLSHEYYKARGVGLLYSIFERYPEANKIDANIDNNFLLLERIGYVHPRGHRENEKDYQRRLRKIFSKHEDTISSGIEKLNNIVDDVASAGRNKEVEN